MLPRISYFNVFLDGWEETLFLEPKPKTWEQAKQYCFDMNMTLVAPEHPNWNLPFTMAGYWEPEGWELDIDANSFRRFWTGYREIGGEWVYKPLFKILC